MSTQNETRRARHYRDMARELKRTAKDFADDESRVSLLGMAQAYQHIADKIAAREMPYAIAGHDRGKR